MIHFLKDLPFQNHENRKADSSVGEQHTTNELNNVFENNVFKKRFQLIEMVALGLGLNLW